MFSLGKKVTGSMNFEGANKAPFDGIFESEDFWWCLILKSFGERLVFFFLVEGKCLV